MEEQSSDTWASGFPGTWRRVGAVFARAEAGGRLNKKARCRRGRASDLFGSWAGIADRLGNILELGEVFLEAASQLPGVPVKLFRIVPGVFRPKDFLGTPGQDSGTATWKMGSGVVGTFSEIPLDGGPDHGPGVTEASPAFRPRRDRRTSRCSPSRPGRRARRSFCPASRRRRGAGAEGRGPRSRRRRWLRVRRPPSRFRPVCWCTPRGSGTSPVRGSGGRSGAARRRRRRSGRGSAFGMPGPMPGIRRTGM